MKIIRVNGWTQEEKLDEVVASTEATDFKSQVEHPFEQVKGVIDIIVLGKRLEL